MTLYGVSTDYDYTSTHKRERLSIWSGPFMSVYEGEAFTLPGGAGYMVTRHNGDRVRVTCPTPRTDENYTVIDEAINEALNARRHEYVTGDGVQHASLADALDHADRVATSTGHVIAVERR